MASVARINRLLQLVELLQSGHVYNSAQIAEHCEVSRRTIFRDIKMLQDSGLPIRYNEEKQGYSLPKTLYLPPTDFSLSETLSLILLCQELGNNGAGIPFHHASRSAALKLLCNLPRNIREQLGNLTDNMSLKIGPHNLLDEKKQTYDLLLDCLKRHKQVRIQYQSMSEWKSISTLVSPYRLIFSRRSWYLIGRSSLHRAIRTFNIGRINDAESLESGYQVPPRFTLERYLGHAWHLIRERGKRTHVVVRFQKMVATNVAEVQWHHSQEIIHNPDGTIDFHVTVDGLSEIIWWILGYGDQAEVLEPVELRENISKRIDAMHQIYQPAPK